MCTTSLSPLLLKNASLPDIQTVPLHIPDASPAWKLLLQSGVGIACTVGIPFMHLLRDELGLDEEQLRPIDAFLLDGMPVDEPETAVVPAGARIALAAGLPGIAGLAMKSNSAVRALRTGITHTAGALVCPRPGVVLLSLYSLVLPLLGAHILRRGVLVDPARILRYARFAPEDRAEVNGTALSMPELEQSAGAMPEGALFLLTAVLCHE